MTALGSPITENFDTLATTGVTNTWTDDSTIPGWYSSRTAYRAESGSANTGALYSFGTGTATERALGGVASGSTGTVLYGVRLTNNTGSTITSLDISFFGEQWRNGGVAAAHALDFQYQVASTGVITGIASGTWLDFDSLDFTSPTTSTTAAALDGNAAANRTAKASTLMVTVNNGQEVWLRWSDIDNTGGDHGLAIDDLSVTPHGMGGGSTDPSGVGTATPSTVFPNDVTLLAVTVTPGTNPTSTGVAVTGDLSSIGGSSTQMFFDNGTNGDASSGDNIFSFSATVANGTMPGARSLPITITDAQMRSGSTNVSLTLQSPPLAIHDIQGSGTTSPFVGRVIATSGVVTGLKSNGFFIQTPDAQNDADPNTSEGVFVFTSSAPPAAAAIGNNVTVSGTVFEFIPSADPNSPPFTEITGPTVTVSSTGNPLPAAITLTMSDVTTSGGINQLEKFEAMRVHADSLTVIAPTQGNKSEANATAITTGIFYTVLTGTNRPFREPGIELPDPLPAGSPANIPRFDANPERIRIDSDAQPGSTALDLTTGVVVTNVTGPFDYAFQAFTILPDAPITPSVTGNLTATPVPVPASDEFTVASFNMERFYDSTDDAGTSDVVLTPTAFNNRLNKASLTIRNVLRTPDIIGIQEMENLTTLQTLASKINGDAVAAGDPNPNYQAFLVEGNDVGGIDVAFLVKSARVAIITVTQEGLNTTYIDPGTGMPALLNDRPPLVLTANITNPASSTPFSLTVIANHLRSLNGVDDPVDGNRIRTKRRAQAEFLANLIQARQTANPNERIISVGDYNAFQFNDGYGDSIGTIKGTPTPADQVVLASSDLVNPDLIELIDQAVADQRYSFTFDGNAQTLDHEMVTGNLYSSFRRLSYGRVNADFPEIFRGDANRPEKLSDHDPSVAYFALPTACSFTLAPTSQNLTAAGGSSSFTVTTQGGCGWTATPSNTWITIDSGGSETGNGTVGFTVAANMGPARSGTITVNGDTPATFNITQDTGCTFMISPTSQGFAAAGGSGTTNVTAAVGCSWTASTTDTFITITSGSMGSGNGSAGFDVDANPSGSSRSGTITIAGRIFTVTQAGEIITFAASGTVTRQPGGSGQPDVRLAFTRISGTGAIPAPVTTDGSGNWSQTGFENGSSYTVTPTGKRFTFSPASLNFSAASSSLNFSGTKNRDTTGVFRPSAGGLYLKNSNSTGVADLFLTFGLPGDIPLTGDWDGDGIDTIGVYRDGTFYLRNSNTNGVAEIVLTFGIPGDQPIVGDWNGDGTDTIGIYRGDTFMLRNSNTEGPAEILFSLGVPGDVAISGDWNGDGVDTTGVFRPSDGTLFLKNANSTGIADLALTYGIAGDLPIIGDWDADGIDTIGVYRNGDFLLRNSNTSGFADVTFTLGINFDKPVKGEWNGLP
jgi:predicted extracellular nuclease